MRTGFLREAVLVPAWPGAHDVTVHDPAQSPQSGLRQPQLAGQWYPKGEPGCLAAFADYGRASGPSADSPSCVAGIVPHAGWTFSGAVAFGVIRALSTRADIDTVVLFAGHLRVSDPPTVFVDGAVWTPFGPLPSDQALAGELCGAHASLRAETADNHSQDNSAEVQFAMLRHLLPHSRLLIVGVPPDAAAARSLAQGVLTAAQRRGRKLAILGSTDLTHYGPNYGWSPRGVGPEAERWVLEENDPAFLQAVGSLNAETIVAEGLAHQNACCPGAVAAAVECAVSLGASAAHLLRHTSSLEQHRSSSFVGYAGMLL